MPLHKVRKLNPLLLFVVAITLVFVGCSKSGGGNDLHVKSPPTGEKDLAVKSSYAYGVVKTFTDVNGKMTTASTYNFYVANYDLDAGNFGMTLEKPMPSDDSVRVVFSLVGAEGAKDAAPETGTYSAKVDKYMKVESVGIIARKNGADIKTWFDRGKLSGEVKVTSVSGDSASGDIDVTAGDNTIKGSFTAKILQRK